MLLSNIVIDGWYWHTLARQLRGSSHVVDATLHTTDAAETVVLGSSAAHYGIDAHRLGAGAVNLSRHGASLVASAMVLPAALRLRPSTVIVVVNPMELRRDQPADWHRLYHPGVAAGIYGWSAWQEADAHLEGLAGWVSLAYRHRSGFRDHYVPWLDDGSDPGRRTVAVDEEPKTTAQKLAAAVIDGTGPNVAAIAEMARRCEAAGVALVLVPAPVHPDIGQGNYPAPLLQQLDALAAALPLAVIPAESAGQFSRDDFLDNFHLNMPGQQRLTENIAGWLAAR